jgi:hypothetical protein
MSRSRYKPEQIINLLHEVEIGPNVGGRRVTQFMKRFGLTSAAH